MSSTLLQPYELPPFELVKLIPSAFQPSVPAHAGPTSPEAPGLATFAAAATSPSAGPSSPPNASNNNNGDGTLGNRLSQLVSRAGIPLSPPSSSGFGAASAGHAFGSSPSGSVSGITSPRRTGLALGLAQGIDQASPRAGSPALGSAAGRSIAAPNQVIRSVQAGTESIWIAGNEGSVSVWKLDPARANAPSGSAEKGKRRDDAQEESKVTDTAEEVAYLLDQYNVVQGRRPVEKLAVLPTVGKAVVLSEGILTLHALPTFTPLQAFNPIRGVSTFAVDLSTPYADNVRLCIIKRKSMQLLSISHNTIDLLKELPLRTTAILAVLRRSYLCIADAVNYSIVDLDSATLTPLLPISQDPPDSPPSEMHDLGTGTGSSGPTKPKSHQRPSIVAVENDEFLVASHTGNSTLGLFIKENGEPTRGTLEWASNPKSIAVDYPYIVALLQNNTMEVHSIHTQEIAQVIQLSTLTVKSTLSPSVASPDPSSTFSPSPRTKLERLQPRSLVSTTAGFPSRIIPLGNGEQSFAPLLVPQRGSSNSLEKVILRLLPERPGASSISSSQATAAQQSDVPPSTPKKGSALTAARPNPARKGSKYTSTVISKTLLVGKDSVYALCPITLVVQAEALVANNRVEDALNLLEAVGSPDSPEKLEEFCYIKQKAAWKLLFETRFREAGPLFFDGRTDPRVLIHLFPDIKGKMFKKLSQETVIIHKGLCSSLGEDLLKQQSIDGIIETNLVRNYSPHLPPSSPTVTDLHGRLEQDARVMLRYFLSAWRRQRWQKNGLFTLGFGNASQATIADLDKLVDTCLAKLFLEDSKTMPQLLNMLDREVHVFDVDEIAPLLEKNSLHWHLSQMLLLEHRVPETLRIWTELADGKRQDYRFEDGLNKIFNLLENATDTELVTKYGLWLVERDRNLGLRVLTKPAQGVQIDVQICLDSLRAIDEKAAESYLEYVVFTAKKTPSHLHDELICTYLDQMTSMLENTSLREDLISFRREYIENVNTSEVTIVSFTLSKSKKTESMRLRGKLILMLHGSVTFDINKAAARLGNMPDLIFENAILAGKLGQHQKVLFLLANDLKDLASAEAYCTHAGNGDILSARHVREILKTLEITPHPSALFRKDGRRKQANEQQAPIGAIEKEEKRKELLNTLIKIQLERSSPASASLRDQQRTAHVIETQAIRISAKEILPSIPDDWPLPLMESFLIRNMRRTLHERYERKLVKALLQSQTLDTSLKYWEITESMGGVLAEEADDDDDDGNGDLDRDMREKAGVDTDQTGGAVIYLEKPHRAELDDEKTVDLS